MKVRAYIRIAKHPRGRAGYQVDASLRATPAPLTTGSGQSRRELHTIRFAVDFDVPRELFEPKDWPTVEVKVDSALPERLAISVPEGQAAEAQA